MIRSRFRSFTYALKGLKTITSEEANFRIHLITVLLVILLGIFFNLGQFEWVIIVLTCGFVLVAEALNTALENLCDHVTIEKHPMIAKVKDISAAAVFLAALTAVIIGVLIFGPHLSVLF